MRLDFQAVNRPRKRVNSNRGIWAALEGKARDWAVARGEVYIFTGPIYAAGSTPKTIGANKVAVPNHLYKIVFDPKRVEAIAFVMPNKALNVQDLPTFIVSVDQVEALTGLDFLSEVNAKVQQVAESEPASGLWE